MKLMSYSEYLDELKNNVCEVTFTKVNGEKRVMTCTLKEDILPPATKEEPLTQTKVREINEKVVSVWDTNANGWRSFRVANVTGFKRVE